ncbi:DUF4097 family beta strand repeat-containing protein [Bacillus sp. Au-Bac7]|uniref:DUF4097 family beta strand repeat-containing protein n=1 Tax=Bacillus sp. Au-Bac7 TaxID=2906458 RepID=UPI001E4B816C|nr:DUF4097 domain-containing protein [Bacillus sp. Au-Bac7]MCE4052173.1 DUF4097 family beta strand repeat-containing protein [Bacillus sp. Au-Bac7]
MADEKRRILQLLEEGKLTIDEALSLIEKAEEADLAKILKTDDESFDESVFQEKKKEPYQQSAFKFQSAKDKLFDFVDTAVKKVKEVDLDQLNITRHEEVSHIFQFTEVFPKNIDVDIPNGEVELIPWDQQEIRIECKAKIYRVDSSEQAKDLFLKEVKVKAKEDALEIKVNHKWMKLQTKLYVPKNTYHIAKVRLFTGSIKTYDLFADQVYAKTANGKITINAGQSEKLEADSANGGIVIENSVIQELDGETLNGAIKAEGFFKKVDLQSFNGNILCIDHSEEIEVLELKGTTGSIEVQLPEELAVTGSLKTNFGGFNVELEGIQIIEEKNDVLQKVMEFQSIQSLDKRTRIEANTKTGSIKIKKREQQ